jgi:hypothetical protein
LESSLCRNRGIKHLRPYWETIQNENNIYCTIIEAIIEEIMKVDY